MKCQNCGAENAVASKFCIRCGSQLNAQSKLEAETVGLPVTNNEGPVTETMEFSAENENRNNTTTEQQNLVNDKEPSDTSQDSYKHFRYASYLFGVLVNPYKNYKEAGNNLSDIKIASILTVIAGFLMMIGGFVNAVINAIFVRSLDYKTFKYKTSIDFANLKDLDFLGLIGKNLLIFLAIIVAIATVYYLASLIFKKNAKFSRLLSLSATAIFPYAIFGSLISPILGKIWAPLSTVLMIVSIIYSIAILLVLVNEEVKFDEIDFKIYFHSITLSILGVTGYYVIINLMMSGMKDILDILG